MNEVPAALGSYWSKLWYCGQAAQKRLTDTNPRVKVRRRHPLQHLALPTTNPRDFTGLSSRRPHGPSALPLAPETRCGDLSYEYGLAQAIFNNVLVLWVHNACRSLFPQAFCKKNLAQLRCLEPKVLPTIGNHRRPAAGILLVECAHLTPHSLPLLLSTVSECTVAVL